VPSAGPEVPLRDETTAVTTTLFALLALLGWPLVVLGFFAVLPPRRAAAVSLVGAWLSLPPYAIPIANLPDYSKNTAATIGVLLATAIFCPHRLAAFRPRWFDLPMVGWWLSPLASSLDNGLGLYDGLAGSLNVIVYWGFPYLIGRLHFNDFEGLSELTLAIIVGGLSYVLPCLFELRMSDKLLISIYGFGASGQYRPKVFFWAALECGLWMAAAALTAWWLWRCGAVRKLGRYRFGGVFPAMLIGMVVLCKTKGALILLLAGIGLLWASTRVRTRLLIGVLALAGPIYAAVRIPNLWSGEQVVELANTFISRARGQSLEYRLKNEVVLIAKARERPIFGWGGWNRFSVYGIYDESGNFCPEDDSNPDHQIPFDGLWIVIFGTQGYVGLILWFLILQLPTMLFVLRFPVRLWTHPQVAPASVAATLLGLYTIDCLLNGYINIIYVAVAGGLIGLRPVDLAIRLGTHQAAALDRGLGASRQRWSAPSAALRPLAGKIRLADRSWRLGRTLKKEGRLAEAEAAWRQALDLLAAAAGAEPAAEVRQRWCDCANDLAWLRLHHPEPALRDPAFALALARQVVETCPECEVYWNTLGVAHLRAGDYPAAVAALDRATALGNRSTAFEDVFLAMAHAHLGDWEQARHRLAAALLGMERDYPGHPELAGFCDEAQSLLAAGPDHPVTAC